MCDSGSCRCLRFPLRTTPTRPDEPAGGLAPSPSRKNSASGTSRAPATRRSEVTEAPVAPVSIWLIMLADTPERSASARVVSPRWRRRSRTRRPSMRRSRVTSGSRAASSLVAISLNNLQHLSYRKTITGPVFEACHGLCREEGIHYRLLDCLHGSLEEEIELRAIHERIESSDLRR